MIKYCFIFNNNNKTFMKSRQIVLASRPKGLPVNENFRFEEIILDELKENEVLLKSLYVSVDPYMRSRMNNAKSYSASYEVDKPIMGGVVARVEESHCNGFSKGDVVFGILPWATYTIASVENLRMLDTSSFPASYYLGILGMPGLTAYFGIMDIGKPKAGETVVISGAAGAVGIAAGQIAKICGARVVGIAGSDEKCKILKDQFGFDDAINYKTSKILRKSVAAACPAGIDVYFDNVGGDITDAVINNLNFHSRIILCGQIAHYNSTEIPMAHAILPRLLTRSVMLQGFIVSNYANRFNEGFAQLTKWVLENKLGYNETVIEGFDNLPEAFLGLFSGKNIGKMIVKTDI
jgi:NADPH:quinone reductase